MINCAYYYTKSLNDVSSMKTNGSDSVDARKNQINVQKRFSMNALIYFA